MLRTPVWAGDEPLLIAHRGGLEFAPENTIEAFRSAVDLGVDLLETDVHVTADGVLVSFHDDELDRVTDSVGRIAEIPYAKVAAARLEGGSRIPTLDELIEEFPDVRLNIDVKSDAAVIPFTETVRRHGIIDRIGVAAFSDRRIRRLRNLLGPRLATVASPRETSALVAAARIRNPDRPRGARRRNHAAFDAVQVPVSQGPLRIITARFVHHVHDQGLLVHAWTINERSEMERLLDMGVDGIITDRPNLLDEVLRSRGER